MPPGHDRGGPLRSVRQPGRLAEHLLNRPDERLDLPSSGRPPAERGAIQDRADLAGHLVPRRPERLQPGPGPAVTMCSNLSSTGSAGQLVSRTFLPVIRFSALSRAAARSRARTRAAVRAGCPCT